MGQQCLPQTVNQVSMSTPRASETANRLNNTIPMTTKKRSAADFQFLECIGEGSYSKVYRAVSKKNMHVYAIKVLNKQHIHKEKKRKYVTIEKNTLNVLGKHPGIVTLYYTFQDPKSLYFVIDYAQRGELLNLIHKLGSLSLELSHYYTIQLVDSITFIHNKGIIHRDLKPENILLNEDWKLMVTDFGAAKFVDDIPSPNKVDQDANTEFNKDNSSGSFVGTAEYISPELLKYNESSFSSDFWSLGCILYQMLVGMPPFKASDEYETFERIVELNYCFPDPQKYPIPTNVTNLIQNLLLEDPNARLDSKTIKVHPWFKHVDWNDRSRIWGKVPKLEKYHPEKYFKPKNIKSTQQQQQAILNTDAVISQKPKVDQKKSPPLNHVTKPIQVDDANDKPGTALKKQIIKAQSNSYLMNKVLNNRIEEKNKIITKTLIDNKQPKAVQNDPMALFQVEKKRHGNKVPMPMPKNEPPTFTNRRKLSSDIAVVPKRNSATSLSSLLTTNESSKSVIIKSKIAKSPVIPETVAFSTNISKSDKRDLPKRILNSEKKENNTYFPSPTAKNTGKHPQVKHSTSSPNMKNTIKLPNKQVPQKEMGFQQGFIPKRRVPSSDAAAAAGAIGTLLTHNRHLKSTSSTSAQYKQLQNHQKQLINPVLLDRQIPSIITSKLMQNETILKLDNIFKSEISHKSNQFTVPGETLNHSILEKIISKYERDLVKDIKACVMLITSAARLFIYELNDNFHLRKPQSAIEMQARDFYSKIIEIKLTNKNVSLYDYEFDEEMHEGYLILELSNLNKFIFLSAWDRSRLIKGGLNSNVRVGFHVNEEESWVKSFLKAKKILKKKEMALLERSTTYNEPMTSPKTQSASDSASSMQQSFRKLRLNTHSKIRSFSSSSKENESQLNNLESASGSAFSPSNSDETTEKRRSRSSSRSRSQSGGHGGNIINGVRELAMGVRNFKVKEATSIPEKKKASDATKMENVTIGDNGGSESTAKNRLNVDGNKEYINETTAHSKTNTQLSSRKIVTKPSRKLDAPVTPDQQVNQNILFRPKVESKAAIAAAMAVGKKR